MQVCGDAGLRICRVATMRLGDGRVSGIWLCGFHNYAPSRGFAVFTPYAGWLHGFFHTPCYYAYG